MKKKLVAVLLTVAMVFTMAGCSVGSAPDDSGTDSGTGSVGEDNNSDGKTNTQSKGDGTYKVGIANREITNDYNRLIAYGAQGVLEKAGCEVVMTDAEADVQKHNENVESLLNSGIDALIIQLGDNDQLAPLCAEAAEKGIPVVTAGISSHIDNTICDVNGDDALMATLLADAVFASIDYSGDVYVFYVPGAPLLENRLAVFSAVAGMYSDINVIPMSTEHNVSKVQTQTEELLTANPEEGSIAAIIGTYDSLISGAVESVRQAGRTEIVMGGIDGDQVSFQMLFGEDTPFKVSVVMDANSIGETAANTILSVLNGETDPDTIPSKVATACYTATQRNGVEAAEMKWGETVWEDIGFAKSDVEAAYPQDDEVIVCYPTTP
ncbi:substrate-binding domain-containing protein [Bariatricus sp. SGI.154]|uniref:substrate-binding domain-containing protein n=1 Tax=Bariatricus sp. SGI.154 TaxID=3420549 RepID=UPI003CFCAEBD